MVIANCQLSIVNLACTILLLLTGTTFAHAGPDQFVVHTVAGMDLTGPLAKLSNDGSVHLGGARPAAIAGADVVTIRRSSDRLPAHPHHAVAVLTHGDRIPFDAEKALKLEEGRLFLHLRPKLRDEAMRIPRAFVSLLWLTPPDGVRRPDRVINQLARASRPRDIVLLRNGDQLTGTLTAIEPERGARVETGGREVTVPLSRVAAIAFNTELQARMPLPKSYRNVILTNGGRLSFVTLKLDAGGAKLMGKTLFGARLEIPLSQLAACEPRSARVVFLSGVKPKQFQHTPFLGVAWPLAADSAVSGGSLRLEGNTFDKGLGVHTKSVVTYALDGGFRWFEAVVGLDEISAGPHSETRIRVLVDGKEQNLGTPGELKSKTSLALRLNVTNARELTLVSDFGSYGDVRAHVNWAEARLIR